jgi:hypothetical protein
LLPSRDPLDEDEDNTIAAKPPPRRTRSRSRSITPSILFAGPPLSPSRSPSPPGGYSAIRPGGKLQPLQSSAISDLSSFLAADQAAAKEDEKRLKKAKWRASQGLGVQEGMEGDLERLGFNSKGGGGARDPESDKKNRDYVQVMGRVKAAAGAGGQEGGKGTSKD